MTNVTISHRNAGTSNLAMVSADQETILGNGTTGDPIRLASGSTEDPEEPFEFQMTGAALGLAVVATSDVPSMGIPNVISVVARANAAALVTANSIGIVVGVPAGSTSPTLVQITGVVELPAEIWTIVADGDLITGSPYYLSTTTPGHLVATKPTADGTYAAQVGVALSTTRLLLSNLQYEPVLNQGT